MVIGRLPECDITFDDSNLSRRHAEISMDDTRNSDTSIDDVRKVDSGTRYVVTDLGSTNGTKVNGSRISAPHALRSGDVITVGLYSITFEDR
ncbi:MAG: FHA domain-containing protein [Actinomycetota bacterium]